MVREPESSTVSIALILLNERLHLGVMKDVAMIGAYQEMTIDFVADQPGPSLFHCHMQQHMDFGFMMLFDCS